MEALKQSLLYKKNRGLIGRKDYCLDVQTPIPTVNGWKTMGDLEVGDNVFDEKGNKVNITWVSSIMQNHHCYKVEFSDGSFIINVAVIPCL